MQYETKTLTSYIEELVATKDDLRKLKDVDELIMLPSIGQKTLEHIESAKQLVDRINRRMGPSGSGSRAGYDVPRQRGRR